MNEERFDSLSSKAEAAFRQAAAKVIQRAKQTGTPVIVWEEGRIKEIPPDELDAAAVSKVPRESSGLTETKTGTDKEPAG